MSYKYLVQNTAYIAPEYGTVPAKGGSITHSVTGATLTRLTDSAESPATPKGSLVVYSRFSPTNSAKDKILIHGENSTSSWVVDLASGAILRELRHADATTLGEVNELRWDGSGHFPNRLYYVKGFGFYQLDVTTGASTLVHDFTAIAGGPYPNGAYLFNDVEGDASSDSRYWCWMVVEITTTGPYQIRKILTYDKQADAVLGTLTPADFGKFHTKRGWAFVSTYSPTQVGVGDNQLFMIKLQDRSAGVVMQRIAPNFIDYPGNDAYRNEGQAALSMDGNSVYWTCNWGGRFPYREAVKIDLPGDWDTH